jgi:hypothetical protein
MPDLNPEYLEFGESFAKLVIERDFDGAVGLFAPWLQNDVAPEDFRNELDGEVAAMAREWEMETPANPGDFDVDWNPLSLAELREYDTPEHSYGRPYKPIPAEVTEADFRKWMVIQFMPAEDSGVEFDAFYDFWFMLVETDGALRVGYYKIEDPD